MQPHTLLVTIEWDSDTSRACKDLSTLLADRNSQVYKLPPDIGRDRLPTPSNDAISKVETVVFDSILRRDSMLNFVTWLARKHNV